jgi:oligopeptide transport system permease protein
MASEAVVLREGTSHEDRFGHAGPWREVWRRFRCNRLALVGAGVVVFMASVAFAAPLLTSVGVLQDPYDIDVLRVYESPTAEHPFGTDAVGRDLLSRTIFGARISLSIGVLVQFVVLVIGGSVGLVAGFVGGRVDNLLMRFTDVMFAFPDLLFVLIMASVLGPGYWNIFLAVGVVSWAFLARLVRAEVLSIKQRDFLSAARASGTRPLSIVARHVIPNTLGPVIVSLTFGIPAAIFTEAFLSFVGVGLRPPTPSWGVMIYEGYQAIFAYPIQVLVPAVALSLATLAFNFVGDGLRDALDPQMREVGR